MTTNDTTLPTLSTPPGTSRSPYILPFLSGENIYIPCSNSAQRLLVTGKETDLAFAVVGTGGIASAPIGFHYHREAHDVFLCLKGNINVWAGDQARTMGPGDFASVPPNTIHQYQILGPYSEFLGLIVPGGWEEFFRFIGEPYSGPLFPLDDHRNPFEVLIPKLKAAAEQFDMVPQPMHPQFAPQPWPQDADNSLPGSLAPYFLKNDSGPKFLLGGTLVRPLATTKESANKFSIATIEGSVAHKSSLLGSHNAISFPSTHHCIQVCDGTLAVTVGHSPTAHLGVGETVFLPAGTEFSVSFASAFAKAYVFAGGAGLPGLLHAAGTAYEGPLFPEKEAEWDGSKLAGLAEQFGCVLGGVEVNGK